MYSFAFNVQLNMLFFFNYCKKVIWHFVSASIQCLFKLKGLLAFVTHLLYRHESLFISRRKKNEQNSQILLLTNILIQLKAIFPFYEVHLYAHFQVHYFIICLNAQKRKIFAVHFKFCLKNFILVGFCKAPLWKGRSASLFKNSRLQDKSWLCRHISTNGAHSSSVLGLSSRC